MAAAAGGSLSGEGTATVTHRLRTSGGTPPIERIVPVAVDTSATAVKNPRPNATESHRLHAATATGRPTTSRTITTTTATATEKAVVADGGHLLQPRSDIPKAAAGITARVAAETVITTAAVAVGPPMVEDGKGLLGIDLASERRVGAIPIAGRQLLRT